MQRATRLVPTVVTGALSLALLVPVTAVAAPTASAASVGRSAEFAAAAAEFGVPDSVLLAVSYNETLWEDHDGQPSSTGAYGLMALTDLTSGTPSAKGDDSVAPALRTLTTAAGLINASPADLRTDEPDNIRGGAALLASYARGGDHGALPASVGGWYDAVAEYAGAADQPTADAFADQVFQTIRTGVTRHTADGQTLTLAAQPDVQPVTTRTTSTTAASSTAQLPECPRGLACSYVPAVYAVNGPAAGDYGNYDLADRPNNHLSVNYIVIHDTEESYADTVAGFQNPAAEVSANYVVQGTSGTVTQMVPDEDMAWHAGNWYMNMHAVGIEQVGYAVQGATWFTERLYQTTADLVRYLAAKYQVPLDRQHIIGHDNVPGPATSYIPGMHWDPGPFWDWNHFMALLGRPTVPTAGANSPVVTINPVFADNIQSVTDCTSTSTGGAAGVESAATGTQAASTGTPVPPQPASFVYLRTAPSASAPLFNDPGYNPGGPVGTTCANDWGDKASAGQQFVVAGRQGDWVAIWWDGSKVWFENPRNNPVTTPTSAFVVVPKPGVASVPTYGVAYPAASEFPAAVPVRAITPLNYTIRPGQSYVYGGVTPTDYYYATVFGDTVPDWHTDIVGTEKYLEIQLGHRIAFVNAADVLVLPA